MKKITPKSSYSSHKRRIRTKQIKIVEGITNVKKIVTSPKKSSTTVTSWMSTLMRSNNLGIRFIQIGVGLIVLAIIIVALTFYPIIREEIAFFLKGPSDNLTVVSAKEKTEADMDVIIPASEDFGIVIPKIRANAPIVADVDPFNEKEYQYALTKGVAQAKGTVYPNQTGNVFLFAHSAGNFYEANRYNAVFYLLNKLETNDKIIVFHNKERYTYRVTDTEIVNADQVEYLHTSEDKKTITLMTCWPAGTTLQRLIVKGDLVKE